MSGIDIFNVAVFSSRPNYCPECGHTIRWTPRLIRDWDDGEKIEHFCGFTCQAAERPELVKFAKSIGGKLQ
jgi:hypothetical protein